VGFGSKERPRNGIFGVLPARKMGREPKNSLLPNPAETLATQAKGEGKIIYLTDNANDAREISC